VNWTVYRVCDSLQQTISKLYWQAGIKQGSSRSGRPSLAAKVLAVTGDVETVQTILGHACLDHSKPYSTGFRGGFNCAHYTEPPHAQRRPAQVAGRTTRLSFPILGVAIQLA
jgi:integrase